MSLPDEFEIRYPAVRENVVPLRRPPVRFDPQEAVIEARNHWVNRYITEWARLANGRIDDDIAQSEGLTLHHIVGHRPPEEIARQHFNSCTGAADTLTSAQTKFHALAAEVQLIQEGDELSPAQLEFAHGVAELCAAVGDQFRSAREGSAGDLIRANYGPVPF